MQCLLITRVLTADDRPIAGAIVRDNDALERVRRLVFPHHLVHTARTAFEIDFGKSNTRRATAILKDTQDGFCILDTKAIR